MPGVVEIPKDAVIQQPGHLEQTIHDTEVIWLVIIRWETEQQIGNCVVPDCISAGEPAAEIEVSKQRTEVADSGLHEQKLSSKFTCGLLTRGLLPVYITSNLD